MLPHATMATGRSQRLLRGVPRVVALVAQVSELDEGCSCD